MDRKLLKVEIRKSNIHGDGVFAKINIQRGEKLCKYDGYIKDPKELIDCSYALGDNINCIDGYRTKKNEEGIAQFINCGAKLDVCNEDTYVDILNKIDNYNVEVRKNTNVIFRRYSDGLYAISIKSINADEEILVDYGPLYWMTGGVIKERTEEMLKAHAVYTILNRTGRKWLDVKDSLQVDSREGGCRISWDKLSNPVSKAYIE